MLNTKTQVIAPGRVKIVSTRLSSIVADTLVCKGEASGKYFTVTTRYTAGGKIHEDPRIERHPDYEQAKAHAYAEHQSWAKSRSRS